MKNMKKPKEPALKVKILKAGFQSMGEFALAANVSQSLLSLYLHGMPVPSKHACKIRRTLARGVFGAVYELKSNKEE